MIKLLWTLWANKEKRLVIVAQGFELIGGVVILKLLASLLPKVEFGHYALATSLLSLTILLPFSVLDQGVARFVLSYRDSGVLKERYAALLLFYGGLICAYVIIFVVAALSFSEESKWRNVLLLLPTWLAAEVLRSAALNVDNAIRNRQRVAVIKACDLLFKALLLSLAIKFWGPDAHVAIGALATAGLFSFVILLISQRSILWVPSVNAFQGLISDIVNFSWPILLWGVFGWMQQMANRWILQMVIDTQTVAEFSLMTSVATLPVNAILGLVAAYALPMIYSSENAKSGASHDITRSLLRRLAIVYAILILVTIPISAPLLSYLASKDYVTHAALLPFIMGAAALYALASIATYELYARHETRRLLWANVVPGIFALIFGIFVVPHWGLIGAVLNFCATFVLCAAMIFKSVASFHCREAEKK